MEVEEENISYQHLLASDIDGTLLRDGEATPGLKALKRLIAAHRDNVALVYATGRSFASTIGLVESGILPKPQAIASFVGTEIWMPAWHRSVGYQTAVESDWRPEEILYWAKKVFRLRLQEPEFQSDWKLSFYLDSHAAVFDLRAFLQSKRISARVIYSCGKYLDIIPHQAGKANAVRFLRNTWRVVPQNVLTCGDSGNDIDMLTAPRTCNVAVGNLEGELERLSDQGHFYVAELPYAGGVLEGAAAFDFWPRLDVNPKSQDTSA
ncbi:MAG: HAD-IIB family hydrolase [Deltaproteobacteria bacterium]|nr:HAD-IIB family hydrolase [Deltaproteobacteria bacterium]